MKKLEELFDMESTPTFVFDEEGKNDDTEQYDDIQPLTDLNNLEKIDKALPAVKDLSASDKEMDELANLAIEAHKNLMDLAMNVEARFSSEIFASAGAMLGHAITARTAKINKKLKTIELQLKKAKLDQDGGEQITSTGRVLDRNELLGLLNDSSTKQ